LDTSKRSEADIIKQWTSHSDIPVVSICCTTYNHEHFIADALNSFLMQKTSFSFEILIRDDCSTDNTALILKDYTNKYPRLIKPIFEVENQYSKGVKPLPILYCQSKANFIAICEGDDYWTDPYKLQKQVEFLQHNKNYVIAYSSVKAFDNFGLIDSYQGGALIDLSKEQLQKAPPLNTLTVCFRNQTLNLPKEFYYAFHGDLFLWSILGKYGDGKYIEGIQPSMHRVHKAGVHSTASRKRKKEMLLQTYSALFSYYSRINNYLLVTYFAIKMVGLTIDILGITNFVGGLLRMKISKKLK